MQRGRTPSKWALAAALALCAWAPGASRAEAQMPVPSLETPTLHGAAPVNGKVVSAEIGYPALRTSLYFGRGGGRDIGLEIAAPTFPGGDLTGWFQRVGMDVRAPFRFQLLTAAKLVGSLRLAPLFHVGQYGPNVGVGATVGWLMDIPLPKIFKLIVGIDTRWGLEHFDRGDNRFGGNTLVNLGIEAFWKEKFFFTMIINVGAQYVSSGNGGDAVYHHMFGFGYKWQ